MAMNVFFTLYAILKPNLLAEGNPLLEAIAANPGCMDLVSRYSAEEIAAIGYCNLESACPELFSQTDIASSIGSHELTASVPVVR